MIILRYLVEDTDWIGYILWIGRIGYAYLCDLYLGDCGDNYFYYVYTYSIYGIYAYFYFYI